MNIYVNDNFNSRTIVAFSQYFIGKGLNRLRPARKPSGGPSIYDPSKAAFGHKNSTRSLCRCPAAGRAALAPAAGVSGQGILFSLTHAIVALAFYPGIHGGLSDRCFLFHRGGHATLKPKRICPCPQAGRLSHRKSYFAR